MLFRPSQLSANSPRKRWGPSAAGSLSLHNPISSTLVVQVLWAHWGAGGAMDECMYKADWMCIHALSAAASPGKFPQNPTGKRKNYNSSNINKEICTAPLSMACGASQNGKCRNIPVSVHDNSSSNDRMSTVTARTRANATFSGCSEERCTCTSLQGKEMPLCLWLSTETFRHPFFKML